MYKISYTTPLLNTDRRDPDISSICSMALPAMGRVLNSTKDRVTLPFYSSLLYFPKTGV